MPLYNYKCNDCGAEIELLIGVGAQEDSLKCTNCQSENITKLLSLFGTSKAASSSNSSSRTTCPTGTCPF